MANQPLTVIAPIQSGQVSALREVLDAIAADLTDNPYLQLAKSQTTHFLRLAIMTDPDYGDRLLMTGNYDGGLSAYLQELLALGPNIDEIWNKCVGYRGRATFEDFIRAHAYPAQAAYTAVQGETVRSIRLRIRLRETIENLLDTEGVAAFLQQPPGLKPWLADLFSLKSLSFWQTLEGWGVQLWRWIVQLKLGLWDLLRRGILRVVRFIGEILGAPEEQRTAGEYIGVNVDFARLRMLNQPEVVNGTNHLHLLSTIRPGRLLRLRIVLLLVNFAGRFLFPPGSLSDIRSIHFAHWSIVDEGQHLLFVTHYGGSFDNYLGDFADRASDGLNSVWNNVEGYPKAGAFDIVAFKQFFRNDQQPPSQVFYRAYPNTSVENILRDLDIIQPLANALDPDQVQDWLIQL